MTFATAFAALHTHLLETNEADEMADIIWEVAVREAKLLNPQTDHLMKELIGSIPGDQDDIYDTMIADAIEEIGTDDAEKVAARLRELIGPF